MAELIERSFETLSEAEAFCDEQIDVAFERAEQEGRWLLFRLEHSPEERVFRLLHNDPAFDTVEAHYQINDC